MMMQRPLLRIVPKVINNRRSIYYPRRHGLLKMSNPETPWFRFFKEIFTDRAETKRILTEELVRIRGVWKNAFHIMDDPVPEKNYYFDHFDSDEAIKRWKPVADSDTFSGYSTSMFGRSREGHALFSGNLDTRIPDDGICQNSGFVGVISPHAPRNYTFSRNISYNWSGFNMIEIRCRGDGRKYFLVINTSDSRDEQTSYDGHCFPIYTRAGPYWQTIRIPRENLLYMFRGRLQDDQLRMPDEVKFLAIVLNDSYDGPFSLEIDYIALKNSKIPMDLYTTYEGYCFPHLKFKQDDIECLPPE